MKNKIKPINHAEAQLIKQKWKKPAKLPPSVNTDSIESLVKLLIDAIQDNPYFDRDSLTTKLTTLIKSFRLNLEPPKGSETDLQDMRTRIKRLIDANELHNREKQFWKDELRAIVGNEKMQSFYDKRNLLRANPIKPDDEN